MSEWRTVELGDIADFSNGINFDKSAYTSGVPFIGVSNFGDRFSPPYDELEQVKTDIVRDSDYLQEGDIVFVRSNGNKELVGRCMLIRNCPRKVTFSGFCIRCRLRNPSEYDPVFFAYYFKSNLFRRAMSGTAIGANIQNLSQGRLSSHKVSIPDIASQHYIADILSAYDSLIETNQRQIKLLEDAAQRLYKEWFVDLRFPGHEDVPVVDGVPEGWKRGTLQDIVVYHDTKRRPLSGQQREKMKGKYRYYGAAGILDYVNAYLFDGTYLLFGEDGTVITEAGFPVLQYVSGQFWVNNHAHVMTGRGDYTTEFLYAKFKQMGISDVVTGVAQPKISQGRLSEKATIIPDTKIVKLFNIRSQSIFKEILLLQDQISYLSEARDRLLPKLMSGEIAV